MSEKPSGQSAAQQVQQAVESAVVKVGVVMAGMVANPSRVQVA